MDTPQDEGRLMLTMVGYIPQGSNHPRMQFLLEGVPDENQSSLRYCNGLKGLKPSYKTKLKLCFGLCFASKVMVYYIAWASTSLSEYACSKHLNLLRNPWRSVAQGCGPPPPPPPPPPPQKKRGGEKRKNNKSISLVPSKQGRS